MPLPPVCSSTLTMVLNSPTNHHWTDILRLKTFQGELWSHGPTTGKAEKQAKELDRAPQDSIDPRVDRSYRGESIDLSRYELDRSPACYPLDRSHAKGVARSIPCRATKLDRSRSVSAVRSIPVR
ncbi:unnamed protein product [Microthlaspi erraticum]|uniref:Uncharacterized protein n=1 Tax=Microthlaspi erraticum TaxID=1685480 RepID=A0A6D2I2R0_9BRAS|nr:unnamed protein product [Microthlaspi erraticum]